MNTKNIQSLKNNGYVAIAYPEGLRKAIISAITAWKEFCALSTETKKGLPYSNTGAGCGYELKDGVGNNADRKENFDVQIGAKEWLIKNAQNIQDPVALHFAKEAITLADFIKPIVLDFAKQSEQAFDLHDFPSEVDDAGLFIRFIHYFGDRKIGEETASAHVDQSGFTLHLFESAPGLQCLTYGGKWIDMPVSEGETVIIPAMQMQLRSQGDLKALCHRVIATVETADGGRYSAVCFVQLKNTPRYDKDKHGRLQEKVPGFNYKMPHREFVKLFKK